MPTNKLWRTHLSFRERRCLELREEGRTLKEIAAIFKVSPNRIRQIVNQAHKILVQEQRCAECGAPASQAADGCMRCGEQVGGEDG